MPRSYKNPLPLGPLDTPPRFKSEPKASLSALSWAAEKEGKSYGLFTINLSPDDQVRIQSEYEAYQREEKAAKERRRAEREASQVPSVKTTFSERPALYADPEIIFDDTAADADYTRVAKDVEEISVPIPASLDSIPWWVFEKKYAKQFPSNMGQPADSLRVALGSQVIKDTQNGLTIPWPDEARQHRDRHRG